MDFELREILRKIKTPENPFCNIPKSTVVTLDRSPHKTSTKHDRQNYFHLKFTNIFEFRKLFYIQLGRGIKERFPKIRKELLQIFLSQFNEKKTFFIHEF